jgi:hypothetical protein
MVTTIIIIIIGALMKMAILVEPDIIRKRRGV